MEREAKKARLQDIFAKDDEGKDGEGKDDGDGGQQA